ncbi:hypothetical protein ABZ883_04675 [Streptomyces sp. NPDC046977]|uniref:hypothetical protein n=1 Tax=Streptomyces sp. NPDC046977 TaxID=3154703 RepID=UPI0033F61DCC
MKHSITPTPRDIDLIAAAINAARNAGIYLPIGPNPHVAWSPLEQLTVPAYDVRPSPDDDVERASWEGGHALIVELGDCELHGRCQCGTQLGTVRVDKPLDDLACSWERHVMVDVPAEARKASRS